MENKWFQVAGKEDTEEEEGDKPRGREERSLERREENRVQLPKAESSGSTSDDKVSADSEKSDRPCFHLLAGRDSDCIRLVRANFQRMERQPCEKDTAFARQRMAASLTILIPDCYHPEKSEVIVRTWMLDAYVEGRDILSDIPFTGSTSMEI